METQELLPPSLVYVTDTWQSDITRYRRDVEEAKATGCGDSLTLAEMECSLDLIEADLLALLRSNKTDERTKTSIKAVTALKQNLEKLVAEMRPLCRD